MPAPLKLFGQNGEQSGPLKEYDVEYCPFFPKGTRAITDFAMQDTKVELAETVYSGSQKTFEIDRDGTVLSDLTLCFEAPALTDLVVGGTYKRYSDFTGLCFLSRTTPIEINYATSNVIRISPDDIFSDHFFQTDEHKQECEYLLGGKLTEAERNTKATGVQEYRIPLPVPWRNCGDELPISALASKLKIRVTFAPAKEFIQTDGVKPDKIAFTNVYLRAQVGHVNGELREQLNSLTYREDGRYTLFEETLRIEQPIPANAMNVGAGLGFTVDLKDFVGPMTHITGFFRIDTDIAFDAENPKYYELDTSILNDLTFQVRSGTDKILFEPCRTNFEQVEHLKKMYPCSPNIEQFYVWFDKYPAEPNVASGHIELNNFNSTRLYLKKLFPHPAVTLVLIGRKWNWTNIKNGNYVKLWQ